MRLGRGKINHILNELDKETVQAFLDFLEGKVDAFIMTFSLREFLQIIIDCCLAECLMEKMARLEPDCGGNSDKQGGDN